MHSLYDMHADRTFSSDLFGSSTVKVHWADLYYPQYGGGDDYNYGVMTVLN